MYRVLRNLEKTPTERLKAALAHGRLFGLQRAVQLVVDGVPLRALRLERIFASKRAAARTKDLAVIPALEEALAALEDAEHGAG